MSQLKRIKLDRIKHDLESGRLKLPTSAEQENLKAEWSRYVRKIVEASQIPAEHWQPTSRHTYRPSIRFDHRLDDMKQVREEQQQRLVARIVAEYWWRARRKLIAVNYLLARLRLRRN